MVRRHPAGRADRANRVDRIDRASKATRIILKNSFNPYTIINNALI